MEQLEYIIEDSTIAEVLGVQNFSNEESAVLELVKNAYDAQSLDVIIIISRTQIIIEDDGVGMNRQKIIESWMHVGKSDKKYIVGEGENARVLAGSKGVGRFAIARLGAIASVFTKMKGQEAVLWNECREKLGNAIKSLKKRDAQLVQLLYFEEITVKEAANIFGCSRKTIGKHRDRILKELRQRVGM